MRTLYLLRHAKSGWDDPNLADFDRPLSGRGHRETAEAAALFADRGYRPATVICSTARRTRETLAGLLPVMSTDMHVEFTHRVYEADAGRLLDIVRGAPEDADSLLLVGHNPGLEQLARTLAGHGDPGVWRRLRAHYPPAGLTVLQFGGAWTSIGPATGLLQAFETPAG
jgi:phosphohistidine phosphatase